MEKEKCSKMETCEHCQEKDYLIKKLFNIINGMQDLVKTCRPDDVKRMKVVR